MEKNDVINLKICDISSDGFGVGKTDEGFAVFVPNTAIDDIIECKILSLKKNFAFGKCENLLTSSASRIAPDCPAFAKCGGCMLRHISYDAERSFKQKKVYETMRRIGKIEIEPNDIISLSDMRYRNKAQYPIAQNGELGFYALHSHRVIPQDDCRLQPAIFSKISAAFREYIKQNGVSVYNEETHKGLLRHLYLRRGFNSGEIMAVIVINGENLPNEQSLVSALLDAAGNDLKSIQININKKPTNVVLGGKCRVIYGTDRIKDTLCGVEVSLSPFSFYQVNSAVCELLYKKAADYCECDNKDILDLYCGAGTIGLSLAKRAKRITGVEIVEPAVKDAVENAKANGINNARFICADAKAAAQQLKAEGYRPDAVILDPPRKGCDKSVIETVANDFAAERVVYISCDVATLARDCAIFETMGYKVKEYTPVDMFPRTAHVETVVKLTKVQI